jgi:hypothetical protein
MTQLLEAAFDDALVLDAGAGRLLEVAFDDALILESGEGRRRPGTGMGAGRRRREAAGEENAAMR